MKRELYVTEVILWVFIFSPSAQRWFWFYFGLKNVFRPQIHRFQYSRPSPQPPDLPLLQRSPCLYPTELPSLLSSSSPLSQVYVPSYQQLDYLLQTSGLVCSLPSHQHPRLFTLYPPAIASMHVSWPLDKRQGITYLFSYSSQGLSHTTLQIDEITLWGMVS